MIQVKQLFIYPVKSLGGIELTTAKAKSTGFKYDRNWMIVSADGNFLTQRQLPKLALIQTQLSEKNLTLISRESHSLEVPLTRENDQQKPSTEDIQVRVWSDLCMAQDEGSKASEFLEQHVGLYKGQKLRLMRFSPNSRRVIMKAAPTGNDVTTFFADGYPYLVISQESVDDLNDRLNQKGVEEIPINRFRPNIVLEGLGAYGEDQNLAISLGHNVKIQLVSNCVRCVMTTIDQTTGKKGIEPLSTFSEYRKNPTGSGVIFGQNAILCSNSNIVEVGMPCKIDPP